MSRDEALRPLRLENIALKTVVGKGQFHDHYLVEQADV